MQQHVTIWHLEMTESGELNPTSCDRDDVKVLRAKIPCPELNRFFYGAVGSEWYWMDRLGWNYDRWQAWLDRPEVETWVLYVAGTPAGYFELERQDAGDIELAYLGLLPRFTGQGLGPYLLTVAVERAWAMGAQRVWAHTCSIDHPGALAMYQKHGFDLFKVEEQLVEVPDDPLKPWPNA